MEFLMTAALFLARLIAVYSFLIWIRIFISWVNPYPRPGSITYYLARIVDPYLNLFRTSKARIGMLDFSPILAIAVLSVAQSLLNVFAVYGTLTLGITLAALLNAFWTYGLSVYLWIAIFSTIIRMINSNRGYFFSDPMPRLTNLIRGCFSNPVSEMVIAIIELIVLILLMIVLRYIFSGLVNLAIRIPF